MVDPCSVSKVVLSNGAHMPVVGLGTWKAGPGEVRSVVENAIKLGYRHIDCACDYGNEVEVGEAIKSCIEQGVCTREELWITSKLWNTYHAREHVELACRKTLADLKLDYLDLYLIHFPISLKFVPFEKRYPPEWIHDPEGENPRLEYEDITVRETWEAMESLVDKGLVRNIGVSNFNCQTIMDMVKYARIRPVVNQVEIHPYLVQTQLVEYLQSIGIHLTAFSPLGSGSYISLGGDRGLGVGVLSDPVVVEIAASLNRTPAQVVLRWNIQRGNSIVPKSVRESRMIENISLFDFELTNDQMNAISALDRKLRFNDPGEFCKSMGGAYPIYG